MKLFHDIYLFNEIHIYILTIEPSMLYNSGKYVITLFCFITNFAPGFLL